MRKTRLLWQLFPSYLIITLISVIVVAWYSLYALREFHLDQFSKRLQTKAQSFALLLENIDLQTEQAKIQRLCVVAGEKLASKITVTLANGQVVGDSAQNPQRMTNLADRPEIQEALRSGAGMVMRYSPVEEQQMMYVAIAVPQDTMPLGTIRVALPIAAINQTLQVVQNKLLVVGIIIALLVTLFTLLVSYKISRPLEEMRKAARHFAKGELAHRLPMPATEEMSSLADSLNRMAAQLEERISATERHRRELEAVLSSMTEGVLAVDSNERLIKINASLSNLLGLDIEKISGRSLQECIRSTEFQDFVRHALRSQVPLERDIVFLGNTESILQAQGTALKDSEGGNIGALIVLNDVTRLRKLEALRKEFVANVSHELKTPITTIKGYVETLLSEPEKLSADAIKFLQIVAKHAERLHAIVEDLLSLSRIEQESDKEQVHLEMGALEGILKSAIEACQVKAQEKNIQLKLHAEKNLQLKRNPSLLEQAVINLIDNAIKYSEMDSTIWIEASRSKDTLFIKIKDEGCGIPSESLSRLFERFYRVDKARSRKLGGTGLGLAIVKHIAQAHYGTVEVESQVGKGSIFTIKMPAE